MAKPLGQKSLLIRQAITAHPDKTPKELAELLNDSHDRMDDKLKFTPNDVSQQKQAMKKPGAAAAPASSPAAEPAAAPKAGNGRRKPGRKPGKKPAAVAPVAAPRPAAAASGSPVDLIDRTFALAQACGGMEQLKRLVERLAGVQH